jgi:RNA polymerase sigma-70 factor (ECF subfamily)
MPLQELDDRELMQSLKQGDHESLALLHSRHRKNVVNLLRRMTHNSAIAEELTQDVFLRVYQARTTYKPTAAFSTWLYRIAFNRALNWIRSQSVNRRMSSFDAQPARVRTMKDGGPSPEHLLLDREMVERVREAILSLPPRHRAALTLHKYEGLDYAQIAASLNTSVPAVKSLLFRTYLTLQDRLKPTANTALNKT